MISNQALANPFSCVTPGASGIKIAQRTHFSSLMDKTIHRSKTKVRAAAMVIVQTPLSVRGIKQLETTVITTASAKQNIVKYLFVMSLMSKTN